MSADPLTRWRARIERTLTTWEGLAGGADFHEAEPGLRYAMRFRAEGVEVHRVAFGLSASMWHVLCPNDKEYGVSLALSWLVQELTRDIRPTDADRLATLERLVKLQSARLVQFVDARRKALAAIGNGDTDAARAALAETERLDESPGLERRALLLLTQGMCEFCVIGDTWHYHSPDCPVGQALGHLSDEDTERVADERRAVVKAFEKEVKGRG